MVFNDMVIHYHVSTVFADEMPLRTERAGISSPTQDRSENENDDDGGSDSSAAVRAFGSAFIAAFRNCPQEEEGNG